MPAETITVTVACAEPGRQSVVPLTLPAGATAAQALEQSGVLALHPGIDAGACVVGIWGREVPRNQRLRDGDRVEVLRPLTEDPRERRRRVARTGGTMGRGSARRR
ncbi:MAG: RnfH family protein [Gammaproteobacteria bacterium]